MTFNQLKEFIVNVQTLHKKNKRRYQPYRKQNNFTVSPAGGTVLQLPEATSDRFTCAYTSVPLIHTCI